MPQPDHAPSPLHLALTLIAGLAQALSLAVPWDGQQWTKWIGLTADGQPLGWLQLVAMTFFCWQLQAKTHTPRQAFFLGWVFATAWLAGTFWWLFTSMHTYGGLAAPLAALAVLGLAGVLALYYAVACMVFKDLSPVNIASSAIVFAALWTLAELARGVWFTGFPWGAIGYAHVDSGLARFAPFIGVYGMGALAAAYAMCFAIVVCNKHLLFVKTKRNIKQYAVGFCFILGFPVFLGQFSMATKAMNQNPANSAGRLSLTLLQGNIPQDEKFEQGSGVPMALQWYAEQLKASTTSLTLAPETAVPMLPSDLPVGYLSALQQHFNPTHKAGTQAALIGIPLGSMAEGYTNSVIALAPAGHAQGDKGDQGGTYRYDKHHLVPFGEFIPPLFRWFTQMMNIPLGDFNRGAVGQASFAWQGQRLAPNICYEDLFGEELGTRFTDPATAPTVFVNVSNLAWFGDGAAMSQHLNISRLRALEFSRPMVRATNTGATVVIDHKGHVTASLPRSTRGVLRTEVEGRNGVTFYAQWVSRFGLWPVWLLAGLVVAVGSLAMRRRDNSSMISP
jgi:apolipoprotein N-acyltransferase